MKIEISHYFSLMIFIFSVGEDSHQKPYLDKKLFTEVLSCVCGKYNTFAPRIVGGEEAVPNQHPWMVAIFNEGKLQCGGSLINDRYVLTAGHCLNWSRKKDLKVVLGYHGNNSFEELDKRKESVFEIEDVIVHEDFSSDYLHDTDDIGLIKLKNVVEFNEEIHPICLPKIDKDYSKKTSTVTGWGMTAQDGNPSGTLKKAKLTVLKNEECKNITGLGHHIVESMLCAYEYKSDACQGDSGGPLAYELPSGIVEQIGVVSWGIGCAKPGMPGVYTRVAFYLEWIALHTIDANYCNHEF